MKVFFGIVVGYLVVCAVTAKTRNDKVSAVIDSMNNRSN